MTCRPATPFQLRADFVSGASMSAARLTALLIVTIAASARGQELDPAVIDREARDALRRWDAPGLAVVLVNRDRGVTLRGYGAVELGRDAITPDTVFPLASCTKSFTSTALAILVGDKKIDWDDPVRKHFPSFHLADPNADALVTVRDLLCHRTGLASHDYLWYRAPWSQDEMIRRVGKLPLSGQFRSSFAYQSIMFMAAGKIVAGHDPDGWDGFVRRRLLTPLQMTSTSTTSTDALKKPSVARGHKRGRDGKVSVID